MLTSASSHDAVRGRVGEGAVDVGFVDDTEQGAAVPGGQLVPVLEPPSIHLMWGFWREGHEMSGLSGSQCSAASESPDAARTDREPWDDRLQVDSPALRFCPHRAESGLQPGDAAPRQPQVAVLAHLQREGRRRVVADDSINGAIQQSIPESILVLTAADRRTALELTRSVRNLLCGERQVVRAGFNGDANAVGFGLTDVGERVRIGEMNDCLLYTSPSPRDS